MLNRLILKVTKFRLPPPNCLGTVSKNILGGPSCPPCQIGLRTKQAKDVVDMIADFYKVSPLTYPKIFHCDNGSEFKAEVTEMLEKHEVKIRRVTTKYKYTHTAFVEALNKILAERLFKVQDA